VSGAIAVLIKELYHAGGRLAYLPALPFPIPIIRDTVHILPVDIDDAPLYQDLSIIDLQAANRWLVE